MQPGALLIIAAGAVLLTGCGAGAGAKQPPKQQPAAPPTAHAEPPRPKANWYAQHHGISHVPCGDGCDYATHHHSEVKLLLGPNGQAQATDHGERMEETANILGDNGRVTHWDRKWRGSWSEGNGRIKVVLKPEGLDCERIGRDGQKDQPCKAAPLKLICEKAKVQVSKPKKLMMPGWVCVPKRHVHETHLTPLPWVFGQQNWLLALERGSDKRRSKARRQYAIGDVTTFPRRGKRGRK